MKIDPRLTLRQKRVLRAYRDGHQTLEKICAKFRFQKWLLSRWLDQPRFRKEFAKVQKGLERRGALEFSRAVRQATDVMARILNGGKAKIKKDQRDVALGVLKLHFAQQRTRKSSRLPKSPQFTPAFHPDVSLDEARELISHLTGLSEAA